MKLILIAAAALGIFSTSAMADESNANCTQLQANWENAPPMQCIPAFPNSKPAPEVPPVIIIEETVVPIG